MPAPRHTYQPSRRQPPRQRRSWFPRLAILGVLVALIGGAFAALAYAASTSEDRAPKGATVGGVDIGGLDRDAALTKLARQLGHPATKPVEVEVAGKTFTLTAKTGKIDVDYDAAVDQAIANANAGSFVERGWHKITGSSTGSAQAVTVTYDRDAVRTFVDRIAANVERPATDATLDISLTSVDVTDAKSGRALADQAELRARVARKIRSRGSRRTLAAETEVVKPGVTKQQLLDDTPTVATVDKSSTTVRVFEDGKLDKTYSVAVGSAEYPTPAGQFTVQTKQVNPTWNVPQSEWAGSLAGQTIPGGDPRNPLVARWIGFNGAVGFHGTADGGSIGSAASHGCVRMNPSDVIDLYKRLDIGSTVLVA